MGLVFDEKEYQKLPLAEPKLRSRSSNWTEISKKSLRSDLQIPVLDQGPQGSCTAFATVQAAAIQYRIYMNRKCKVSLPVDTFSASFIYNQSKITDYWQGPFLKFALQYLKDGICFDRVFPYDPTDCEKEPDAQVKAVAADLDIWDYERIFPTKREALASENLENDKINAIINTLETNRPVIVGSWVPLDFMNLNKETACDWKPNIELISLGLVPIGGHAMVVTGYDNTTRKFELLNSWSKDWGCDGYAYVNYDDFVYLTSEAFALKIVKPVDCPPK